ncbi:MAG TPA: radical SAM protein [Vicinamibacterales bacterium]|nr:radical SAM protein [Vicinamibacterales bacterium]
MTRLASPAEMLRRIRSRADGRLRSLPVLVLTVHSACNCRCVMCDIWKANAVRRELTPSDLDRHVAAIERLRVTRVVLTGGEPLLHTNLWALCRRLKPLGIRLTLLSTGLLLERHAADIVRWCDDVIVSIDGSRSVHDRIRRVERAYDRIASGIAALRARAGALPVSGRCVVQRANVSDLSNIVAAAHALTLDRISFLAADVTSAAFNRPAPWDDERRAEVAIGPEDLPRLHDAVAALVRTSSDDFASGFIEPGPDGLWHIVEYYRALAGRGRFPALSCNAPWVSAVLETDGAVRPCFFHPAYPRGETLESTINSDAAIAFRQQLDVGRNATCAQCVCRLNLGVVRSG